MPVVPHRSRTTPVELLGIETAVPEHVVTREETRANLPVLAGGEESAKRFASIVGRTRIGRRHAALPLGDLLQLDGISTRAQAYRAKCVSLAETVARRALHTSATDPSTLDLFVSLSCTGYMLPSLDAYVIAQLGIDPAVRRVPITELGCSAGVSALGLAGDVVAQRHGATALITSVELCSLCIQTHDPSDTDVIGNVLFGDAAAAVVLKATNQRLGPEIVATRGVLWPQTTHMLGMQHTETGFRLVLAPELSQVVAEHLPRTLREFLAPLGLDVGAIAFWAVHPGGPKILEAVARSVALKDDALRHSWDALARYGNVSSASVFFILEALRASNAPAPGDLGIAMAFGPGVSCEIALIEARGWLTRHP
jgi:alkylresorcinol/alkylpyrone synthase